MRKSKSGSSPLGASPSGFCSACLARPLSCGSSSPKTASGVTISQCGKNILRRYFRLAVSEHRIRWALICTGGKRIIGFRLRNRTTGCRRIENVERRSCTSLSSRFLRRFHRLWRLCRFCSRMRNDNLFRLRNRSGLRLRSSLRCYRLRLFLCFSRLRNVPNGAILVACRLFDLDYRIIPNWQLRQPVYSGRWTKFRRLTDRLQAP